MHLLSRSEEIILVVILKLGDGAYGVSIREQIHRDSGDTWSFASIYQPLERLHRKKYVEKVRGEPTSERGGKSKFFYRLTTDGRHALRDIHQSHRQFWTGVPQLLQEPDDES